MQLAHRAARVKVPATSANLGPGYDSMGLALAVYDEVSVTAIDGPTTVSVEGAGAGQVPTDDSHLVVQALRLGLDAAGCPLKGVDMHCHNRIPHSRGMGSSASAIVAGLALAQALAGPEQLSDADILTLGTRMEGHPDNVAPAVYGGITVAWSEDGEARCLRLDPPADLVLTVFVPSVRLGTAQARALLPEKVPHADAAFNASRAALLAASLATGRGDLFAATEDRLHQAYRAPAMTGSYQLVQALRQRKVPAVISGAGPTVLAFGEVDDAGRQIGAQAGFEVMVLPCPERGVEAEIAE
ncbi:MAG: homoserine kinase [Actinomycetaceae bacterium]|nr:homoserine kinase [Actinomycetaceae bacterium]MDU0969667.1 homoserine kinase [Actinomycetaceae bacterium]